MTDLATRLAALEAFFKGHQHVPSPQAMTLLRDQAARIAELKAALNAAAGDTQSVQQTLLRCEDTIRQQAAEIARLRGAISWLEPPFVDYATSHDELKQRVGFCLDEAKRVTLGETQP